VIFNRRRKSLLWCSLATLLVATVLSLAPTAQPTGPSEPVHLEWKQRLTQTSRRYLRRGVENPFTAQEAVPRPSPYPEEVIGVPDPLIDTLASVFTRSATSVWSIGESLPNPYLLPENWLGDRDLGEWDWRKRLRLIREVGSLWGLESATGEAIAPLPSALPSPSTPENTRP
jgi:hypothetical protein